MIAQNKKLLKLETQVGKIVENLYFQFSILKTMYEIILYAKITEFCGALEINVFITHMLL